MPPSVCRSERQHIGDLQLAQPLFQAAILAVERVSHHRTERPLLPDRLLDELQGNFGFGAKSRILLALGKIALWCVRLNLHRVIHLLVGPQAGHGNHAVVDFAHIPQVLTCHMSRLVTVLAIPSLINH
jgi:hypothetical protein